MSFPLTTSVIPDGRQADPGSGSLEGRYRSDPGSPRSLPMGRASRGPEGCGRDDANPYVNSL
jgi:hypothetical protein